MVIIQPTKKKKKSLNEMKTTTKKTPTNKKTKPNHTNKTPQQSEELTVTYTRLSGLQIYSSFSVKNNWKNLCASFTIACQIT